MIVFSAWSLVICPFQAFSQEAPSFEDAHQDKSFVFLLMEDDVELKPDWSFTRRVRRKVKILKEDAMGMGEVPVFYDRKRDRITSCVAMSITPDGKKHRAVKSQDMARYSGQPMYSDSMVRVLSVPAVGVGSVIDVDYTISSSGLPMKNAFWDMQSLRQANPVQQFRYSISFPKKLGLRYREFGLTQKPDVEEKNGMVTYRWALQDLYDEEKEEDYVPPPSPDDPMEAFEFSSIGNWEEFARWYSGLIEKNTRLTPQMEAKAKALAAGRELAGDKVCAILEYIQDNYRYVSMSFGENAFEPHPTDEVFRNKYGDCKDLSLLARTMLKVVGVTAHLALFREENEINDPSYDLPIPNLFDHVLLFIEDPMAGDFYADPLLKGYDRGEYPAGFERAYTFIINDGKGEFRRLPEFAGERMSESTSIVTDINSDWSGVFEASMVWDLDDSILLREKWKALNGQQRDEFFERLEFEIAQGGEVIAREIDGLDRRYGRIRTTVKYRRPEEFPSADGLVVIDLQPLGRDEAFEKKERRQSFFFSHNSIIERDTVFRVPEGFGVFYVPADLKLDGPYLTFSRVFDRTPSGVTVKESLRTRRLIMPKEALGDLREFRAELSRLSRQRIVFRRD